MIILFCTNAILDRLHSLEYSQRLIPQTKKLHMAGRGKRWCFTINNPEDGDVFWKDLEAHGAVKNQSVHFLIVQEEKGKEGTTHYQGYIEFDDRVRMSTLKTINKRAHWEQAKGTATQNIEYCSKEDTYTGGLRYRWGEPTKAKAEVRKTSELRAEAAEELEGVTVEYKRLKDMDKQTVLCPGFVTAYNALTQDILGPYRPSLQIITLVGPPGIGKSYAIQHFWPEHGRCIYGNCGCWFQNPTAKVMIFEEFCGQIPLQRMLQLLDPYPLSLEVKGRMAPAMYDTVVITSNSPPCDWYSTATTIRDDPTIVAKRKDAIHALYDRLGYSDGSYIPVRKCGHYYQAPTLDQAFGMSAQEYIETAREAFWLALSQLTGQAEPIIDDSSDEE